MIYNDNKFKNFDQWQTKKYVDNEYHDPDHRKKNGWDTYTSKDIMDIYKELYRQHEANKLIKRPITTVRTPVEVEPDPVKPDTNIGHAMAELINEL